MTTPQPDYEEFNGSSLADGAGLGTFTVHLPRRRFPRLFNRNPLVRITDRVEALVSVLAVAVMLLSTPVTAAVGTAVYDSRRVFYAEQGHTRSPVTATVIDDGEVRNPPNKSMMNRPGNPGGS